MKSINNFDIWFHSNSNREYVSHQVVKLAYLKAMLPEGFKFETEGFYQADNLSGFAWCPYESPFQWSK